MAKVLKLEYSCEIDNLLDVMAEEMGLSYREVEKMSAQEGIYPEGSKVFVTTRFKPDADDKKPLRAALRKFMLAQKIQDLYITYPI